MKKLIFLLKFLFVTFLAFLMWAFSFEKFYLIIIGNIMIFLSKLLPIFGDKLGLVKFPDGAWVNQGCLLFRVFSMRMDMKITVDSITANVIPYTALCFATIIKLKDRIKALLYGYLVLIISHLLALTFILILYIHGSNTIEGIKIFLDGVFLTLLPIGLWFLFVLKKKGGIDKFLADLK